MVSISLPVPNVVTVKSLSTFTRESQVGATADSSSTFPDVSLNLGGDLAAPLTYNAKGAFTAWVGGTHHNASDLASNRASIIDLTTPRVLVSQLSSGANETNQTPESSRNVYLIEQPPRDLVDGTTQNFPSLLATVEENVETPLTTQASSAALAAASAKEITATEPTSEVAAAATTVPAITAVTEHTADTSNVVAPLPVNFVVSPAAQALANFETNPAYPAMISALYVNAAVYRSQEISSADVVKTIDLPQPVSSVNFDNANLTNGNGNPTDEQHRAILAAWWKVLLSRIDSNLAYSSKA